jgi:hypothetical protein
VARGTDDPHRSHRGQPGTAMDLRGRQHLSPPSQGLPVLSRLAVNGGRCQPIRIGGPTVVASSPIAIVPSIWTPVGPPSTPTPASAELETVEASLSRVFGTDVNRCPHCGQGRLCPIRALPPSPSGHRPTLSAMRGLNACASPLRRRLLTPPQPVRPRPPIDPFPPLDHTSSQGQVRDPSGEITP